MCLLEVVLVMLGNVAVTMAVTVTVGMPMVVMMMLVPFAHAVDENEDKR